MDSRDTWEVELWYFCRIELEMREKEVPRDLPGFWLVQMIGWWCHSWRWGDLEEDLSWGKAHEFSLGYDEFVISNRDVKMYIECREVGKVKEELKPKNNNSSICSLQVGLWGTDKLTLYKVTKEV